VQRAGLLVDLVLDRVRVRGDFDDDVDLVGNVAAGGYVVEAHEVVLEEDAILLTAGRAPHPGLSAPGFAQ
jgi:hypothetical protein